MCSLKIRRPRVALMMRDMLLAVYLAFVTLILIGRVQTELHRWHMPSMASLKSRNDSALAGLARLIHRQVVGTEDHILRRNGNGTSVNRLQEVVGGKHEESCLSLSLGGQRNVNRHLVAVEVGVECGADQRVKLDSTCPRRAPARMPESTDGAA